MPFITFGLHSEDVGLVDDSVFQAGTESSHFLRVASAADVDRERRSGDGDSVVEDVDGVMTWMECFSYAN
jgi:hypothetical protein